MMISLAARGEVYKCDDGRGQVIYSGRPCGENSQVIDTDQGGPAPGAGLRESEKALLKGIEQRETSRKTEPQAASPPPDPVAERSCNGIDILSYTSIASNRAKAGYIFQIYGQSYRENLVLERCAEITFRLYGYHDRLTGALTANEIGARLTALLADGTRREGAVGYLRQAEEQRIHRDRTYSGVYCFGNSESDIQALRCR